MNFFRLIPLANFHHLNRGPEESPSMGSLHLDVFTQPRPKADISLPILVATSSALVCKRGLTRRLVSRCFQSS